ncbi:MAG: prolipoprotein diacylglyceryl transferase, partial [Deltaproteobacteria bacterium]|nr:prolipoprotein diacylglyceryl transferase [Deltaproteobacteria bacterium]
GFPIVDFMTRLGCLLAGCCYGKPSPHNHFEWLLYVVFNNRQGDAGYKFPGVHLWPTQIYSMMAAVVMFLICYSIDRHKKFKGQIVLSYLMLYAVIRTCIELLRGDVDRGLYFHNTVSTAQIMSFLFFTTCAVLYQIFKRKYPIAAGKTESPKQT